MKKEEIKRILVPIDFSTTAMIALDHATFIARYLKSDIILLHVHETQNLSSVLRKLLFDSSHHDERKLELSVEEQLEDLAKTIHSSIGVTVTTRKTTGKISSSIIEVATELDVDLIMMGTHGAKGVENFMGGSNTFRVVASAPCPVISVNGNSGTKGIKDIVLPIDTSKETRQKVDDAISFALHFGSTIHIVGVTTSDDESLKFHLHKVVEQVAHYIKEVDIPTTTNFFAKGNISSMTLDYARKINADLIVMMTEQELKSNGFFMGPFAQQLINESNIPVLSIRPIQKEGEFVMPY